jgi:cytoskeletal protein RodZ
MPESLGEKLRQAREERDISISEVAEQTRISALYLEAIENDDYRTLPGGIFNKGFVKSFAKYVGIDEHEALSDYARLISIQEESEEGDIQKSYRPEVLTDDNSGPSMLPTIIFAVIILGLMTWGILALVNYLQNTESSTEGNTSIAETNVKVPENSNTNTNVNSTVSDIPSTDEIKAVIKAPELSITATIDGKSETVLLSPGTIAEKSFTAEESLKFNYYKGLAETVELTINGKKIETPLPPPGYKKQGFEYEINMSNLKKILEDGKISFGTTENTNTEANATPVTNASQ